MSSEEVFKVTSFHPPAVKTKNLCAIRCKRQYIFLSVSNGVLDNFLPDSLDKNRGTLSVSPSGEVSLNYTGNRNCKVISTLLFLLLILIPLATSSLGDSCDHLRLSLRLNQDEGFFRASGHLVSMSNGVVALMAIPHLWALLSFYWIIFHLFILFLLRFFSPMSMIIFIRVIKL